MFLASSLTSTVLLLAAGSIAAPADPTAIVGGTDALPCEWPSTVGLNSFDTTYCTGTLIHPEVVLTAAHCLHPDNGWGEPTEIVFGESGASPQRSAGVQGCQMHPEYDHYAETHSMADAHDLAFCVLSDPVLDVVPTPPIMGCEVDQLDPGDEIPIVGFGADSIEPDGGGGVSLGGGGTKRHIVQTLEEIDGQDQLFLLGMGGSACSGDSGGPAYFQLEDGSWRVLATTARNHPDAPPNPPFCTYGVVYTGIWNEMDWFEGQTGLDLTPCHDVDGTWSPGPDCTDFPMDPQAEASWADACAAQPLSGAGASCAPEPPPTTGDTGDTGDDDETGTPDGTGSDGTGSSSGGSSDGMPDPDTGLPGDTGIQGSSTGGPAAGDDDSGESGCGCRGGAPDMPGALGLLVVLLGWRRRR